MNENHENERIKFFSERLKKRTERNCLMCNELINKLSQDKLTIQRELENCKIGRRH